MKNPTESMAASIPFEKDEIETSITRRFRLVARLIPDLVAVDVLSARLTYAQLDGLSDQIALAVSSHESISSTAPVAVLIEERHLAIAALLGVLKAGKAAVVFPSDLPLEQLSFLWNDSLQPLVLTTRSTRGLTGKVVSSEKDWLIIDDPGLDDEAGAAGMALPESQPGDLAIISYTSGSSGNPKGVMQPHRMILQSARLHQTRFNLSPGDRNAVLPSFGYGAAKTQIFAGLLSGATIYIPNVRKMSISLLIDWLQQEQVTILASPPIILLRQIMEGLAGGRRLPHVRLVVTGGEDFYRDDVEKFWSCFQPQTNLVLRLTGSETQVIREISLVPGIEFPSDKVPVGYPVPDKEVRLLDEDGTEVPPGEIGEIVVCSKYMASGYWRNPELTAARFKSDPSGANGSIFYTGDLGRINTLGQMEHLGRKDNMVKIHGFSVHLETVDQALCKLSAVQEGASAAAPLPGGDRRLVAYLVPKDGAKSSVREIRQELSQLLPDHMHPAVFVWLDALPRTSTGKVDRKAFPPPPRERPNLGETLVLPRDDTEASLAAIWTRLLQLDEVGVEDNFFDLGGDSLLSVQMVIEAERLLGFSIPKCFFQKPTISYLVGLYREWEGTGGDHSTSRIEERRLVKSGYSGKRVTKYQAAFRKILHREWSLPDIFQKLKWFATTIMLDINDAAIKKSILKLHYKEGLEKLSRWVSSPLVTKRLYRKIYRAFTQLLDELEDPPVDPATAFQAGLMGNVYSRMGLQGYLEKADNDVVRTMQMVKDPFWISLLKTTMETPLDELDALFPVDNMEFLEQAYQAGKGVIILTYHTTVNRLAVIALSRRFPGESIPTISEKRARRESGQWQNNDARDLSFREFAALKAGVALEGQHLLVEGKMVQFVSDNEYDRQGHAVIIGKRRYFLRPGFAELALNTGALVVPQYNYLGTDKRLHMIFLPQFVVAGDTRGAQINNLLDQYAAFINASWKAAPGSIRWPRLIRHFNQPLAS